MTDVLYRQGDAGDLAFFSDLTNQLTQRDGASCILVESSAPRGARVPGRLLSHVLRRRASFSGSRDNRDAVRRRE